MSKNLSILLILSALLLVKCSNIEEQNNGEINDSEVFIEGVEFTIGESYAMESFEIESNAEFTFIILEDIENDFFCKTPNIGRALEITAELIPGRTELFFNAPNDRKTFTFGLLDENRLIFATDGYFEITAVTENDFKAFFDITLDSSTYARGSISGVICD